MSKNKIKKLLVLSLTGVVIATVLIFNNIGILKGENLKVTGRDSAGFYIDMSTCDIKNMFDKISNIKIGSSYDEIIQLIGPPTFDKKLVHKEPQAKPFRRVLDYYVKKYEKNTVNEKYDMFVRFELDINDNLLKIHYIPNDLKSIIKQ